MYLSVFRHALAVLICVFVSVFRHALAALICACVCVQACTGCVDMCIYVCVQPCTGCVDMCICVCSAMLCYSVGIRGQPWVSVPVCILFETVSLLLSATIHARSADP